MKYICSLIILSFLTFESFSATLTVDDTTGGAVTVNGLCSITEAIEAANTDTAVGDCPAGDVGSDTIELSVNITLAEEYENDGTFGRTGTPAISSEITIDGQGFTVQRDNGLTCNGDDVSDVGEFRLLRVTASGVLDLQDISLRYGCADLGVTSAFHGGAVYNAGELSVITAEFLFSQARFGGGIYNSGSVTAIENSIFSDGNSFLGSGIHNAGGSITSIKNCLFSDNTSTQTGGGVIRNQGTITAIEDSTFSNNSASAIVNDTGVFSIETVSNCTFFGNTSNSGAGILNQGNMDEIRNSTFYGNTSTSVSAGGFHNGSITSVTVYNSLFYDNTTLGGDADCSANSSILGGSNISDNASGGCPGLPAIPLTTGTVLPLAENGCLTTLADGSCVPTHALQPTSEAVDAANAAQATSTDQRGFSDDGLRDIGAFEYLTGAERCVSFGMDTSVAFEQTVSTTNELNQAIFCANVNATTTDTIKFANDIVLTEVIDDDATYGQTGTRAIKSPVIIDGQGYSLERDTALACNSDAVANASEFRLLRVDSNGDLELTSIVLKRGCVNSNVNDVRFYGGAVLNSGTLDVAKSAVFLSKAFRGGGIYNENALSALKRSTFYKNDSTSGGGGLFNEGTATTIRNVTFSENDAGGFGGAMANTGTIDNIKNNTFSGNTSTTSGGAVSNVTSGTLTSLENSLFHNNSATNSGDDCHNSGNTFSGTNNMSDNSSGGCPGLQAITMTPATLGPIANNGCDVPFLNDTCIQTHALLPNSEALNAAVSGTPSDQRGYDHDGERDIGAFEAFKPVVTAPDSIGPMEATGPTTAVNLGTASVSDVDEDNPLTAAPDNSGPFEVGLHSIIWSATDSYGHTGTAAQVVTIIDSTAPVITLQGDNPLFVARDGVFTDPGATAHDIVDGDISANINVTGMVDTSTVGSYEISYNVSDNTGNDAIEVVRTVTVFFDCAALGMSTTAPFSQVVTTEAELFDAIACANTNTATADTIELGTDIDLLSEYENDANDGRTATPEIRSELIFDGQGFALQRDPSLVNMIDCNDDSVSDPTEFRLLRVGSAGILELRNMTLANGCVLSATPDLNKFEGGALINSGVLNITNVTFDNNQAQSGIVTNNGGTIESITKSQFTNNTTGFLRGSIDNDSGTIIEISDSVFFNNDGSGIENADTIELISHCLFSGLTGNGVHNALGTISTIQNSTFSDSTQPGIANYATITDIYNSTFSGNTGNIAGGIYNVSLIGTVNNCTFSNNSVTQPGAAIYSPLEDSLTELSNSLFHSNSSVLGDDDCDFDASITGNDNISTNAAGGCPGFVATLTPSTVGSLTDNGCTTPLADGSCVPTHALLTGSEAIDASGLNAILLDQRGYGPDGTRDVGAFEFNGTDGDVIFADGFD
ncbi:choice-of-anchor Q domain-containing protein [Marinicella sediminis]|uniref:Choice-of-anchor Q domain-containing protein n=1 Tax=Marinicella sediminis TaxID=1792834 RepID=A0ABV7J3L4_9GAMM|nr:choice-of-anchor Q domain-containing protein [Marinicella sediminis]